MKFLRFILMLFLLTIAKSITGEINTKPGFSAVAAIAADCPQIDDADAGIFPSSCNTADGKIVGIVGRGGTPPYNFTWYDAATNKVIGATADLLNVAPGTYTLKITDQNKCISPEKRSYVVTEKDSVIFDDSAVQIKSPSCNANDGSITKVKVTNAVQYKWLDHNGQTVSTTADLLNVAAGNYTFIATNATGCSSQRYYSIPSAIHFPTIAQVVTDKGFCGGLGSIGLIFNLSPSDPTYTYVVIMEKSNTVIVNGVLAYSPAQPDTIKFPVIENDTIMYAVKLVDPHYCSEVIGEYKISTGVPFQLVEGPFFLIKNDECGRHTGGVFGLTFTGGTPHVPLGPIHQHYTWKDSLGNVVGHMQALTQVGAGTYTVLVQDDGGCSDTKTFTITDSTNIAPLTGINNITMCLPGTATLSVINPSPAYKYRLYDSTQTAITENQYGIFPQVVTKTTKFYVSTIDSLCESDKTPVTITVVAPGVIIPNTFTPNNDGINDYWDIPHIDEFPGAEIEVFNREGELVYHSVNYSHPFDGKFNRKLLPSGVYYYVIDLKKPECLGEISGSLALIR